MLLKRDRRTSRLVCLGWVRGAHCVLDGLSKCGLMQQPPHCKWVDTRCILYYHGFTRSVVHAIDVQFCCVYVRAMKNFQIARAAVACSKRCAWETS